MQQPRLLGAGLRNLRRVGIAVYPRHSGVHALLASSRARADTRYPMATALLRYDTFQLPRQRALPRRGVHGRRVAFQPRKIQHNPIVSL